MDICCESGGPHTHKHTHTNLKRLVLQVHLEQRVSHQVSEATAIEITVRSCVTSVVIDLRELQAAVLD